MADTYTPNLNLTKPEVGASRDTWGGKTNGDWDIVDAIFAAAGSGTSVGLNVGSGKTLTVAGTQNVTGTFKTDTVSEYTAAAGVTVDGVLLKDSGAVLGAGAVGTPSVTTTGDTNTGLYFPAADTLAATTGGTERLRIDSSGNVGIGTSSPGTKLQVNGALTVGDSIITGTGISTGDTNIEIGGNRTGSGNSFIDFHSTASTDFEGRIIRTTGANGNFEVINTGTGAFYLTQGNAGPILFLTNSSERARIDSSGNVGIGTSSPAGKVGVERASGSAGWAYHFKATGVANDSGFFMTASNNTEMVLRDASNNLSLITNNGNNLVFSTAGSERARIDASGNVGIGTSSPATKLDVNGNLAVRGGPSSEGGEIQLYNPDTTTVGAILDVSAADNTRWFTTRNNTTHWIGQLGGTGGIILLYTAGSERARITAGGAFMVNTTTEYGRVTVRWDNVGQQGIALISTSETYNGSPIVFYNSSAGLAGFISQSTSSVSYNTSSDYRLKQNIVPLIDAAARVQALKPSRFNFIADPARTFDGFIAHEVAEVVPQAVHGEKDAVNDDGSIKPQGIDHSKLVPLLTAALQEALTKITALEARLTALEAK